jgi:hypothetical protein
VKNSDRENSIVSGKTRYVGTPCKICGCAHRYTINGGCVDCVKRRNKEVRDRIVSIKTALANGQ